MARSRPPHDAIVVGAGPAGCAAAYDLATSGLDVVLLDKRRFPRTKACAGGLTIKTLNALRYSVAPVIRAVATDLVVGRRCDERTRLRNARPVCALTVRSELDDCCLGRTVRAGADFRVIRHLEGVTEDGDGVSLTVDGEELRARYVVAADGANSTLRRLVFGARLRSLGFAMEAVAPTPEPAPTMTFDFGVAELGYGWIFPKDDHVNVGLYTNGPDVPIRRDDLVAYAQSVLPGIELDHFIGHHIGLRGWEAPRATRRVFFAGDAAGLVDPLLGEGIHAAVVGGQAAATAIVAGCAGADARAAYERATAPIARDARTAYRSAIRFYAHLDVGYRALTSRPVGYALMKGYARGMTFSETLRMSLLLPLLGVDEPPALAEWRLDGTASAA